MSIRDRVRERSIFDRLRRYPKDGWIAGVCAGLAQFFDWNVKVVRLLFAAALIFGGFFPAGVVYLVLWYLMESADADADRIDQARRSYATGNPRASPATATDLKARFARLEQRLRNMEDCVTSHDFELRRELKKLES